ncbi:hypothetical protein Agub_g8268, partial [Astrephomene gubernaculifera]
PVSLLSPLRPAGQGPSGPTPPSQRGFRLQRGGAPERREWVTVAAVEVAAACRGALLPDPKHDSVNAICITVLEVGAGPPPPGWAYPARILILDPKAATAAAAAATPAAAAATAATAAGPGLEDTVGRGLGGDSAAAAAAAARNEGGG